MDSSGSMYISIHIHLFDTILCKKQVSKLHAHCVSFNRQIQIKFAGRTVKVSSNERLISVGDKFLFDSKKQVAHRRVVFLEDHVSTAKFGIERKSSDRPRTAGDSERF